MFNENTFRALDWLLDEARLHGLRVVLSFIDNWKYPGEWHARNGILAPVACAHRASISRLHAGLLTAEVCCCSMQVVSMNMWTGA